MRWRPGSRVHYHPDGTETREVDPHWIESTCRRYTVTKAAGPGGAPQYVAFRRERCFAWPGYPFVLGAYSDSVAAREACEAHRVGLNEPDESNQADQLQGEIVGQSVGQPVGQPISS